MPNAAFRLTVGRTTAAPNNPTDGDVCRPTAYSAQRYVVIKAARTIDTSKRQAPAYTHARLACNAAHNHAGSRSARQTGNRMTCTNCSTTNKLASLATSTCSNPASRKHCMVVSRPSSLNHQARLSEAAVFGKIVPQPPTRRSSGIRYELLGQIRCTRLTTTE